MKTGANLIALMDALDIGAAIVCTDGSFGACNNRFSQIASELRLKTTGRCEFLKSLNGQAQITAPGCKVHVIEVSEGDDRRLVSFALLPSIGDSDFEILIAVDFSKSSAPSAEALRQMFRLSASEARICVLLGEGLKTDEIACRLGLKASTVRVYLKSIFEKLGVHRRQDVINILVRSKLLSSATAPAKTPRELTDLLAAAD